MWSISSCFRLLASACLVSLLAACGNDAVETIPSDDLDAQVASVAKPGDFQVDVSAFPAITDPVARLGRSLFFSRSLSGDEDVACVSCHHPLLAGADGLSLPVGVQAAGIDQLGPGRKLFPNAVADGAAGDGPNVPRNAPTTFNVALYNRALFDDGRVFVVDAAIAGNGQGQAIRTPDSIQDVADPEAIPNLTAAQTRFPVGSLFEMRGYGNFEAMDNKGSRSAIEARLQASPGWLSAFRAAFAQPSADAQSLITYRNIAFALGQYERSQIFVNNPWRKYLGGDSTAIPDAAKRGAILFFRSIAEGGAGCSSCHSGPNFTNENYYVSGFPQIGRGKNTAGQDFGRREVTQAEDDRYRFRVPSLLNVAKTAPYGHAGTFDSLEAVIRYHVDPQSGVGAFDFTLQSLKQFQGLTVVYPNAKVNSQLAAAAFMASDSRDKLYQPQLTDERIGYLAAFLRTLTDACLDSEQCLAPWIANESEDDPDGKMLSVCFGQDVVPGQGCAGDAGGAGSGSQMTRSGGSTPADVPAAAAAASVDNPAAKAALVATLQQCGNGLATAFNSGLQQFVSLPASASGLTHTHGFSLDDWLNSGRLEYMVVNAAVAVGDVDGDCWDDLLFPAGRNGNFLYLGMPGARFAPSGVDLPAGVWASAAIADLNADYRPDAILGGFSVPPATTAFTVLKNDWPALDPQVPVAGSAISYYRNTSSISVNDFDRDGWPDLFIGYWTFDQNAIKDNHLWKNLGNFQFYGADLSLGVSSVTNAVDFTFSPDVADINNDGRPDLLVAADFENSQVFIQNSEGVFQKVTDKTVITDENGMGSAIGDFFNDGNLDWFVTGVYSTATDPSQTFHGNSGNRLYRNDGTGKFTDVTDSAGVRNGGWGWGACAADFNNDGNLDIYHVNGYDFPDFLYDYIVQATGIDMTQLRSRLAEFNNTPARLFINQGDGHFVESAAAWGAGDTGQGRGVSCFDIDRDGDVDIVIANNSGPPSVLINQTGAGPHHRFISIRLVGNAPSTEALGARIYVQTGSRTQMREVGLNSNYLSNNPLEQHFGLGDADVIDSIRVVWPRTGVETSLRNVPANQFLVIPEP